MKNRSYHAFVLFLCYFCSGAPLNLAYALISDNQQPTQIESDRMVYEEKQRLNTFSGKVFLKRGTLTLQAEQMVVRQDSAGNQFGTATTLPGSLVKFRQQRDGGDDLWIEGQAQQANYDSQAHTITLIGNAQLQRLQGRVVTDQIQGQTIVYNDQTAFFTVNNSSSDSASTHSTRTANRVTNRVRLTLQPTSSPKK